MAELTFKVGDKCVIVESFISSLHHFNVGDEVEIFRIIAPSWYDVCNKKTGDCEWVTKHDLQLIDKNKTETMKAMKDAVLTVAKSLLKANNTVTNLEIKNELRRDYPYYFWTQDIVSKYMDQFAGDGILTFTDNGTYRTYSFAAAVKTKTLVPKTVATKTIATSIGISKVAGKIATQPSRKRGRPRKAGAMTSNMKTINQSDAVQLTHNTAFENVTIKRKNGATTYTKADIRGQKKSAFAFVNRSYGNITAITVAGKSYQVI